MSTYRPFDQKKHLQGPPWTSGLELEAWEEAHGHDVRVTCYVEYGCKALDDHYEELKSVVEEQEKLLEEAKQAIYLIWCGVNPIYLSDAQLSAKQLFYRIKDHLEKDL